jgi:hypothetical protein
MQAGIQGGSVLSHILETGEAATVEDFLSEHAVVPNMVRLACRHLPCSDGGNCHEEIQKHTVRGGTLEGM